MLIIIMKKRQHKGVFGRIPNMPISIDREPAHEFATRYRYRYTAIPFCFCDVSHIDLEYKSVYIFKYVDCIGL
jgi:hypothetical protein